MSDEVEKREEAEQEPVNWVPVMVVEQKGKSALVEWRDDQDTPRRVYVPRKAVKDSAVPAEDLDRGIPYGIAWERLELPDPHAVLTRELRQRGIWTRDDLRHKQREALEAVRAATRAHLGVLNKFAAKES